MGYLGGDLNSHINSIIPLLDIVFGLFLKDLAGLMQG